MMRPNWGDLESPGRAFTVWKRAQTTFRSKVLVPHRNATTALRDAFVRAGLEKDFPYLRADLNAFGHGLVELGRVSPDMAERLALLVPMPLGAADTLLEAGEEPTDLFLRRSPGCTAGPASIPIRTERWRLSGEGRCPAPRVTPWGG